MRRTFFVAVCLIVLVMAGLVAVPVAARRRYGPAAAGMPFLQTFEYSARLLWDDGQLTTPVRPSVPEQSFVVEPGESVDSVGNRLEQSGFIRDAGAFRDYLVYTGMDTSVQSGTYKVSPSMSIVDLAHLMQDSTPSEVTFVVLPGWRIEEVAGTLPTSGLDITPYAFAARALSPQGGYDFLEGKSSIEGFLYPDSYVVPRDITVDQLIDTLLRNFALHLTPELREGFAKQGLTVYQAVTLASIVEREAVQSSEAPIIASVYLNRLRTKMKLDADPTVQYALGYNAVQRTWWTNPLGLTDLQVASPYNTYVVDDLPPTPISNPGLVALQAVAQPAETPYFYFSARCNGSGYHEFAKTFQEHIKNLCQ